MRIKNALRNLIVLQLHYEDKYCDIARRGVTGGEAEGWAGGGLPPSRSNLLKLSFFQTTEHHRLNFYSGTQNFLDNIWPSGLVTPTQFNVRRLI